MVDYLALGQIRELKEVFDSFDHEKKGRLNVPTLATIFQGFGANISDYELQDMITEIDIGQDGGTATLEFKEFASLLTRQFSVSQEQELNSLFAEILGGDTNEINHQNSSITSHQLQAAFKKHGFEFEDKFVQDMIKEVDNRNSGSISLADFARVMAAAEGN
mmetsp:Transcript_26208/g.46493  ORF Transcript_26208/g.46493 Transcript_26208/m.46493 type:complete len:162 (+) Transcript_26208:56-541(+)